MCRWRPPGHVRQRTDEQNEAIRDKYHILIEGEDVPPPIEKFRVSAVLISYGCGISQLLQDMKLPQPLLDYLKKKKIAAPTPIQLQGVPVACVVCHPSAHGC